MIDRPEGGDRVVLVHLRLRDPSLSADLREFRELALSAGANIVATITGARDTPEAKYFAGSGKVEEIRSLVLGEKADLVIFNHTLTPAQERNIERAIQCRVLDRTGLILDIFAQRARSYEGKLQVELAQLKHQSTRLIRGWTHLERQKGGIGLRGPGETQLEVDRRLIRERIKNIQARLEKVRSQRAQSRIARQKASLPTISLVGYTNAGKSTLFNTLTGAEVFVANQLFATLDPTLRSKDLPTIGKVIFADTVGFVRNLPHDLVEAFKATLEETSDADLLLHVIDSQDEMWQAHIAQVEEVLQEIHALEVPRIEVYNKIDLLPEISPHFERNQEGQISRVWVSATKEQGLDFLFNAIIDRLGRDMLEGELSLRADEASIRAMLYDMGVVKSEVQQSVEELEAVETVGGWILHLSLPLQRWNKVCQRYPELSGQLKKSN